MLADIAQSQGAKHGIAQGMDDHVTITVRFHAAIMRNAHATQHDMVAFAEGMHIEALADTDAGKIRHGVVLRKNIIECGSGVPPRVFVGNCGKARGGMPPLQKQFHKIFCGY